MNVIRTISEFLKQQPELSEYSWYDTPEGTVHISGQSAVKNQELKIKSLPWSIILTDGQAIIRCCDMVTHQYDYSDPNFPQNLVDFIKVL